MGVRSMYRGAGAYEYALGACREVPAFAGMTEGGVMWVGLSATGLC